MSKKLLSLLLALVMVFSLAAPIIPAAAAESASGTSGEEPAYDLRIGVLSDIHVSYDYVDEVYGNVSGYFNGVQPSRFEKALRFFKSQGVQAVIVAGDLQEASGTDEANLDRQKDWLQTVVDIWFEVFPEAPGEAGYVEPIFTYGNHDSALVAAQYWPEEWGTYEDAFIKTVNGYSFVCTHNAKESYGANLLEKVAPSNQDKPIFYIQHCPINNTVPGSTGGYGVGYGQTGRANIAPYPNVVAFNGHTHAPLTDEKSIWQGDAGNEGQFTVINTATINYTGVGYDNDMSVNSYAGNAQQTEHGLIVDVTGSEVSVDRYSFNDMTINAETNEISGEAVKIGETWSWDACDVTDRPYAWDTRYATANAPVFADGAEVTVNTVTDTSVTVTVPAASMTAPAGYSDMIASYVVEACNPTSGEVEATGRMATSYHVDDKPDVYQDSYTVTVSGLKAGTQYTLKVYAQEFFNKRSEPLTAQITTTGTLAVYRRGDVNRDGNVDSGDMTALQQILEDPSDYNYNGDIDLNGINETRDITELQAILDGKKITYPETGDLMDLVTEVKLTGVSTSANYQPVDYGTTIQNQVVRGDSKQAVKTWTTNYAYYPVTTMYFAEPVDLSGYTHLSFDTLFENEYNLSDSYRKRWLSLSFISGEQEQIASYGSMNFDSNNEGWTTKTVSLAALKNIDLTAVTGIRFSHNFDYYEGRYDGVTEHGIYWDNFYGLVIEGSDSDLLNGATVTGGEVVFGAGFTNNTNQAIQSTGGTMDFTFESEKVLTDYAGIKVDMRTPVSTTVQVQAFDGEGNLLGDPVSVSTTYIYKTVNISVPAMGLEEGTVAAGLRFTYTCESLLLDNMQLQGSKDYDLIGRASGFNPLGGDSCTAMITTEGGNGSNNALYASAQPGTSVWSGGGELIYDTPLDLSETPYLRFDMKVQNAHWAFGVILYNSQNEIIWRTTHYNGSSSGGQYATYEFDLRTYRTYDSETGYTTHEVTAEQLKDVAKITLTCDLASAPNWMTSDDTALREVWFDNLVACNPLEDFFGAQTSLVKPSAVQDGFVCEIMPITADGHTNVLHWYADSSKNAGTTSAWPGSTVVSFATDVNRMNHSGYTGSYDYLEFDIKTVGMYIAMYVTVKDASGASLGSTGEYRISYEQEWSTFRVDAAALNMSAEDFNKIAQVDIGWNWQHQDANGTAVQYVADVYIDNMGLRSVPADSADLLDQLTLIKNQDWWTGSNGKFTGGGWKFQSDVTADSDKALMFYRSETSQNISYGSKTLYMYFREPITLESGWSLEIDAIKHNYNASGAKVQIIGSDDAKYDLFSFSHTEAGVHTYSTLVKSISGFDPATTTVKGLYFTYPMNPDSAMDKTADGYLVLDNLNIAIPVPMDEDDFLYTATCPTGQNQTAVTNHSLSAWMITPASTGWSYHDFNVAATDISDHTLTMDIMVTNMSNFRMHMSAINGDWGGGSGAAVYYDPGVWHTVSFDLSANGAGITSMTQFSLGVEVIAEEGMSGYALYIDNVKLTENNPEPTHFELDGYDVIGNASSIEITNASSVESGFIFETLDTVDDRSNVIHMYSDPANGGGYINTSSSYLGALITIPANATFDATGVDFVELNLKNTNIYCDQLSVTFYDASGNKLGSIGKRMAMTNDWAYYRYDLATAGLTEEELSAIASISVQVNWSKQLTTAASPVVGEVYIDNLSFGSYVDESTDLFDHIASVQNVEWWWSGNNTYGGAGWLMEENADGNYSFKIYRDTVIDTGAGYTPRRQYLYFDEAITLDENFVVKLDAANTYMGTGTKISLLGDDGNKYGYLLVNQAGSNSYEMAITDFVLLNADTHMTKTETAIDVSAVKIIGAIFHNDYFGGDLTYEGSLVMDNFRICAPEATEPEETEPEVTEPTEPPVSPNEEDPGDLLGATNSVSYNQAHWDNYSGTETGLTAVVDTENVYGDVSTRSWSYKATAEANKTEAIAQMAMPYYYDMTGKMFVFDVKFDSTDSTQTLTLNTRLHETGSWADVTTNLSKTLKAGYWQTVVLDFSNSIVSGKDLTQVQFITFTMDFASNTGTERAVYIDNVRLVDAETLEDDLIHCKVDSSSSGNKYWLSDEHTYGDSSLSIRLENNTSGENDIYYNSQSQYGNDNLPDFKNKIVSAYFYFGDQTPYATLQLVDKSWSGVYANAFKFESVGDGWYLGQVNTAWFTTHSATTDLSQCIRFAINIASGAVVYVDDLKILPGETVDDDWTNLQMDGGSTKGEFGPNTEYTYSEDSVVSLRYEPTGGSYICFHTQNEADRNGGIWDAYPDMSSGTMSAYIYFGDQTPSVKLQLTDAAWKNSTSAAMNLEDVGNGWYHATLDVATIPTPDGFDATQIIRVYMTFTAGQKVYIDDMHLLPAPNPLDDAIANYTSLTKPSAVESGFVCEILEETDDGHTNVIHWYADPNNGAGTTSNWPGTTKLYIDAIPSSVDTTEYDYLEFSYKHYGVKYWFSISVYDTAGTLIGASSGKAHSGYTEWRTSNESGWATHRIDLDTMGLTAEELATVGYFEISVSWEYNNTSGTTLKVGEMWIDDLRFGCVNDESDDMMDRIVETDIYTGNSATVTYVGSDWYWNEDGAFTITRSTNSDGWKVIRLYFDEAVTVDSDWNISCDFVVSNFHHGGGFSLIGSDGKVYSNSMSLNKAGQGTVTKAISGFKASDGTVFDPAAVQIVGIHISYSLGTSTAVTDTAAGGYMSLDNLIFTDPSAE